MNAKDKAQELVTTYRYALSLPNAPLAQHKDNVAKQCALIAVDEVMNNTKVMNKTKKILNVLDTNSMYNNWFWEEVKEEIEKL
jgi:hypothetical protein